MKPFLRILAAAVLVSLAPACDDSTAAGDDQNVTESTGRFELFVGEDGQRYFQLIATNGERILRSEGYKTLSSANKGITSVKKNGVLEPNYDVLQADSGEFYFNLVATNGQIIGTSELYTTEASANGGVNAVVRALGNPSSANATAGAARFETLTGADGKKYFHLRAKNGQIVLQSQGYASTSSASSGITSVKKNGVDASRFDVIEGADGQHTFRLSATNGKIIGRGEMYASKSNALRGAASVRDILREMAGKGEASDAEIRGEVERVSVGLTYMSESDYPFRFVSAPLATPGVTEAVVRKQLGSAVDADPDADKPMSSLFAMEATWQEWKDQQHNCSDPEDPVGMDLCSKMRALEQVLEANLSDIRVFYFGAHGSPGDVEGIGVSIFIVGTTPSGTLAGVRTLAIWT